MSKIKLLHHPPAGSIISQNFDTVHYQDSHCLDIPFVKEITVDQVLTGILRSMPPWVASLLRIRNKVVRIFGIKAVVPAKNEVPATNKIYKPGDRAVFFNVLKRNNNEIVLAENDLVLCLRISVYLKNTTASNSEVYLSTIVHYNHFIGRLYFVPLIPFHRMLVTIMLKHLRVPFKKKYEIL